MAEEKLSLRQSGIWGAVAFGVVLAIIIGIRLDQAALAVAVGVVCGVGASIPTSLLIVALLRRRESREEQHKAKINRGRTVQPPVVIVAPPSVPQLHPPASWSEGYVPSQRQFSVIGEEETDDDW
jgi:hypothetical protein